jgi:hypothetical protein
MNWLTNLVAGLGGGLTAVVEGWQKRATARAEAEVRVAVAKAEAEAQIVLAQATAATRMAESDQANAQNWDMLVAGQMDRTWKDEWFVLLFSVPLILAFIEPSIVTRGFDALDGMPAWYFYAIGTMLAATFGMRRLMDLFDKARGRR